MERSEGSVPCVVVECPPVDCAVAGRITNFFVVFALVFATLAGGGCVLVVDCSESELLILGRDALMRVAFAVS